jgi:pilus assembly protein Flp/PilA
MANLLKRFSEDQSGATAIEYGLIAALIAVAIIGGATQLGTTLAAKFTAIANTLGATAPAGS